MQTNKANEELEVKYGLPCQVKFCKKCVVSNQRPNSTIEFFNTGRQKKETINFDENDICDACKMAEKKKDIDWKKREVELLKLLDKYRSKDGSYDCIVPGSGGKDSCYASWLLKYKYNMHPLTVTWAPHLYTDVGLKNFRSWTNLVDNFLFMPNGKVHRLLTKLAVENLLHPFQPFIIGQKNLAPKMSVLHKIPLVFFGENEAEYGNPLADNATSLRSNAYYTCDDYSKIYLGGVSVKELISNYGLSMVDLEPYFPVSLKDLMQVGTEVHYLGYYIRWTPQECYYHAVEKCEFSANPERTEGTYSKYNSLDDKIDGFHYYTTYIKFGIGRATYDSAQEIRNDHLTRQEGVALVHRFDGEFPKKYFKEILEYLDMTEGHFWQLINAARSPHLWKKENNEWKLRYKVS
jgi:N-acetyl sugar amidotransferase